MMTKFSMKLGAAAALLLALVWARPARADEMVIKFPGLHPNYVFEAEPHALLDPFNVAPGVGFRGTVSVLQNGFVKSINNSIGVSFGLDYADKGVWIPVAMQWNFWLTEHWSVFGEPGLYIYHGVFDTGYCGPGFQACGYPTSTGVDFAFWAGGRFHFNDTVSLTMRIGYPDFSFGVSFFL